MRVLAEWEPRSCRWTFCCALALAVLLPMPTSTEAAAPANDDIADAAELTGLPAEVTASNVDATREPGEPNHGGQNGENSIWFKWTAPSGVAVTARTAGCAPPFQDTVTVSPVVAVYTRTEVFGLVPVAGVGQPFRATPGEVYWIAVDTGRSFVPPQPVTLDPDICLRLLPGPPNDDFAGATELVGFPVGVAAAIPAQMPSNEGAATTEPGEPDHSGSVVPSPGGASLWYRWTAPADGPVWLRACWLSGGGNLAVYTGERVDALSTVAIGHQLENDCGSVPGSIILLRARAGQVYRIAVAQVGAFQLLIGNQAAVVNTRGNAFFSYRALAGKRDDIELRLAGAGDDRALLLEAHGLSAANGCQAEAAGLLRCPIPGRALVRVDVDLGDGNDTADIRLLGRVRFASDLSFAREVLGGPGDDTLTGSAGPLSPRAGWDTGGLRLLGGAGADRLRGLSGADFLEAGPGADNVAGGPGNDSIFASAGPDRIDAGPGHDSVVAGSDADRIRTSDGFTDRIACEAGRDLARLDGTDLSRHCERRTLRSAARAVATGAIVSNDDGDDFDHLEISTGCPVDVRRRCRGLITAAVRGKPSTARSRRLALVPGERGSVSFYSFDMGGAIGRGVRVTVVTRRPRRGNLKFIDRLPVYDVRYEGE